MTNGAAPGWHLLTGEYPPQPGGVSDYTALVAEGLAERGVPVDVWCPADGDQPTTSSVRVHRLPHAFGWRGLITLGRQLNRQPTPRILLVQYVYNAFGSWGMNVPFCLWLILRRVWHGDDVRVLFHEPYFSFGWQSFRRNGLALVTHLMAALLLIAGKTMYVSIPAWEQLLRPWNILSRRMIWLPIPATIPGVDRPLSSNRSAGVVVGHFGTFGGPLRSGLLASLVALLNRHSDVCIRLIGGGGERFAEDLMARVPSAATRVTATGRIDAKAVAEAIQGCDLMLQPYPDGVSSRRTSMMACLANAAPVVTTAGSLSEPDWAASHAVHLVPAEDYAAIADAVIHLLKDSTERNRLSVAGWAWYRERFAVERTIATLIGQPAGRTALNGPTLSVPENCPIEMQAAAR